MKIISKIGMHQESTSLGGEIMNYFILVINATELEPCIKGSDFLNGQYGVFCLLVNKLHCPLKNCFFLKFQVMKVIHTLHVFRGAVSTCHWRFRY